MLKSNAVSLANPNRPTLPDRRKPERHTRNPTNRARFSSFPLLSLFKFGSDFISQPLAPPPLRLLPHFVFHFAVQGSVVQRSMFDVRFTPHASRFTLHASRFTLSRSPRPGLRPDN